MGGMLFKYKICKIVIGGPIPTSPYNLGAEKNNLINLIDCIFGINMTATVRLDALKLDFFEKKKKNFFFTMKLF